MFNFSPGGPYGPCETDCIHTTCVSERNAASQICRHCNKPIGFGVHYIEYSRNNYQHSVCLIEAEDGAHRAKKGNR